MCPSRGPLLRFSRSPPPLRRARTRGGGTSSRLARAVASLIRVHAHLGENAGQGLAKQPSSTSCRVCINLIVIIVCTFASLSACEGGRGGRSRHPRRQNTDHGTHTLATRKHRRPPASMVHQRKCMLLASPAFAWFSKQLFQGSCLKSCRRGGTGWQHTFSSISMNFH